MLYGSTADFAVNTKTNKTIAIYAKRTSGRDAGFTNDREVAHCPAVPGSHIKRMKKCHLSLALITLSLASAATAAPSGELWLAPGGSDTNAGTGDAPLASLPEALARSRAENTASGRPARIILRDGIYSLSQSLTISGTDAPLSIAAAPGAHPLLSGGLQLNGWKKLTEKIPGLPPRAVGKIWWAQIPSSGEQVLQFRQLWVDGAKAVRARQPNGDFFRLVAWDKTNQIATIPAAALNGVEKPAQMEMIIDQVWEIAVLRLKNIQVRGSNALITFKQPESRIEFQHPWPPVTVKTNYQTPFFLANAIEFLDQPGEWFADVSAGEIYYWPRDGEDMITAKVFAPALETLVQIEGTPDKPVANIRFNGITFAHTTWLRPSQQGHVPLQAGMFMLDAKKLSPKGTSYQPKLDNVAWIGRPPAAVSVKNAEHVSFENCTFEHLASAGLDFETGTHDDLVQGCIFRDIGGNGIQLGKFSDTNVETHVPWNPSDERQICARDRIANNVFTDCANEDWGCTGIAAGYVRNVTIEHNELSNLPYTGISVGWGWTKETNAMRDNLVFANRIHDVGRKLNDLAGIYTLSAQPGTVVAENCVSNIAPSPFVPDTNHWFYLYLDEGSSDITVRDNWCPAEKFLRNATGPGNVWTNNGPRVADKIKKAAGLEPAYWPLLKPESVKP
jgi:hypothetical protein